MPAANAHLPTQRILYIDDDRDFALLMQWALAQFGHQVTHFQDPERALHAVSVFPGAWDLLIASLRQSNVRSLDVVRTVKHQHPCIHSAVLAQTLSDDVVAAVETSGAGPLFRTPNCMQQFASLVERAAH